MSVARAAAVVREAGGTELLERLEHLDALAGTRRADESLEKPIVGDLSTDVDVLIAGGERETTCAIAVPKNSEFRGLGFRVLGF